MIKLITVAVLFMFPLFARADEPLFPAPAFELKDQNDQPFRSESLKGAPWIGCFVFTHCNGPCPMMFAQLHRIQAKLPSVKLVLISVDPSRDTAPIRKEKLAQLGINESRGAFITGDISEVLRIAKGMLLVADPEFPLNHSDRFFLFDQNGMCLARYDSQSDTEVDLLIKDAAELAKGKFHLLPLINSTFNAMSVILLVSGFICIRRGNWKAHAACMIAALGTSALFLLGYLLNQYLNGTRSSGLPPGALKTAYLIMLFSHMILAIVMLPMILMTILRAAGRNWDLHRKIARPTLAIWVYVSFTGVLVYVVLYHVVPAMQ